MTPWNLSKSLLPLTRYRSCATTSRRKSKDNCECCSWKICLQSSIDYHYAYARPSFERWKRRGSAVPRMVSLQSIRLRRLLKTQSMRSATHSTNRRSLRSPSTLRAKSTHPFRKRTSSALLRFPSRNAHCRSSHLAYETPYFVHGLGRTETHLAPLHQHSQEVVCQEFSPLLAR